MSCTNTNKIANSVIEYLALIKELDDEYPSSGVFDNPTASKFLYRGLSDDTYKLIPNIFRDTVATYHAEEKEHSITNKTYLAHSKEFSILQNFIGEASAYYPTLDCTDYLRWAEVAQHYGAPTRFLDWTSNPLVSLFFACVNNKSCNGSVWMLHIANYQHSQGRGPDFNKLNGKTGKEIITTLLKSEGTDDSSPEFPILHTPYYFDLRMSAQSSYFMVWGKNQKPLEEMVEEKYYMTCKPLVKGIRSVTTNHSTQYICKITIPAYSKQKIMRELEKIGVTAKTLFPGLDGVGKYIERKYHFDYNEALGCL